MDVVQKFYNKMDLGVNCNWAASHRLMSDYFPITAWPVVFYSITSACFSIKSDLTNYSTYKQASKARSNLHKFLTLPSFLLFTNQSHDLFQLCLCTARIVEKDEPYKPFSHCCCCCWQRASATGTSLFLNAQFRFQQLFFFSAAECGGRCKAAEPGRLFWETR